MNLDIRNRVSALIDAINNSNDTHKANDLEAVEDFIKDCGRYVDARTAHQAASQVARFRMDTEAYQAYIVNLDRNRRAAHDTVMVNIRLMNRLCRIYHLDKMYAGPDERHAMADFALEVATAYFNNQQR